MLRTKRTLAAIMGTVFAAGAVVTPATVAQDPTDLSLWVFVDRHGEFMQHAAGTLERGQPRPADHHLTYETIDYNQMHDNLLAAFMAGSGAPDLVDIEIGKFARLHQVREQRPPAGPDRRRRAHTFRTSSPRAWRRTRPMASSSASTTTLAPISCTTTAPCSTRPASIPMRSRPGTTMSRQATSSRRPCRTVAWTTVETNEIFGAYGLMYMNGGHVYDADGNLVLNSPENAEALQFYVRSRTSKGWRSPTPGATSTRPNSTRPS